ncbi:MAG: NTP transferase domain-containing protein [Chloroflexota bacterium]|nr:NTP transferase domain-containing protein [Chloroflexota bacterium]
METALDALRLAVCDPGESAVLGADELHNFASNCVVALPVGGEGSRLRSVTDALGIQKNALRLPNGETLIERTIRMYRDEGFREFVALVFHSKDSIVDLLGDGSRLGVRVVSSEDPGTPVGRGGAIRNALANGAIPRAKNLIVHNPDDVIARYTGSFPRDVVAAHLAGVRRGAVATAIMVDGARMPYTGMRLNKGIVEEVTAYPFVPIPAHIGVTLFSPAVYPLFDDLFDLTRRTDFEGVLFPVLARERKLYSAIIPTVTWFQVNDPKSLDKLMDVVREEAPLSIPLVTNA